MTSMSSWVFEKLRGHSEGEGSVSLWSEGRGVVRCCRRAGEEASQVVFEAERTHEIHNGCRLLLDPGHVDGREVGWCRLLVAAEV